MKTIFLLTLSNVFMTFAWYGHLKGLRTGLYLGEAVYFIFR
ncbi:MAG: DMT family protein [Geobacteraceae bacterium]